jgi:hypothetical protein
MDRRRQREQCSLFAHLQPGGGIGRDQGGDRRLAVQIVLTRRGPAASTSRAVSRPPIVVRPATVASRTKGEMRYVQAWRTYWSCLNLPNRQGSRVPAEMAGMGRGNPVSLILGQQISAAGWHARMSSRLAGKGACACRETGFQHPASAVAPSGHRRDEWTEAKIESDQAPTSVDSKKSSWTGRGVRSTTVSMTASSVAPSEQPRNRRWSR